MAEGLTDGFCCPGCRGAYALINDLGLDAYYRRRVVDGDSRPLRPEDESDLPTDFAAHVRQTPQGLDEIHLMIEGLQCAACVWLIEAILARNPAVVWGRVNMTTRRLIVRWKPDRQTAGEVLAPILAVGYRLIPYDPERLANAVESQEKELLRAMAVAGFAAGNVMLFSVSIWAGTDMGPATRTFMHWVSALIALPAILYCIRPFARSAVAALSHGRSNMDVPITIGVTIASGMSLFETINWGEHAYFDSAITLLFFLLIGRYLDSRARGRARGAVEHLLTLERSAVTVLDQDGARRTVKPDSLTPGQVVVAAAGDRIGADGIVLDGQSDVDTSLITGETVPVAVRSGDQVFAGTLNLSGPLKITVSAVGGDTLLAEIVRLMELAEQGRARYVLLADRVARYYAPVVHVTGLATFLFWRFGMGIAWQDALMNAVAVLIITCPCALALAVPVVQVIASGRLMRQGILLKSATALERLAQVDWVVLDKTGTLTQGKPVLVQEDGWTPADLELAAGLAVSSRHPLAKALAAACPTAKAADDVREIAGAGLIAADIRLGSRAHVGVTGADGLAPGLELWLAKPGSAPVRFRFEDRLRPDAAQVVAALDRLGLSAEILSGDRTETVAGVAGDVGLKSWRALVTPGQKVQRLQDLAQQGKRVLMVGDGLNDAPALAAAHVSLSPSTAVDVTRTAADVVFQGDRLAPVLETLAVARRSRVLVVQNFVLAIGYNLVTVPLAVAGLVTPLIAAVAMSTSSLVVIANALRLTRGRKS